MNANYFFRDPISTTSTPTIPQDQQRKVIEGLLRELTVATALCMQCSFGGTADVTTERETLLRRADDFHARVRGRLIDCPYGSDELKAATATLRSIEDVSVVLQNLETVARLRKLLTDSAEPISASTTRRSEALLGEMVCYTDGLAAGIASALKKESEASTLIRATTAIRGVRACFTEAEQATLALQKRWRTSGDAVCRPFQQIECRCRMIRAAFRSLLVCAESMARIAARQVSTPTEKAPSTGMYLLPLPASTRQTAYAV